MEVVCCLEGVVWRWVVGGVPGEVKLCKISEVR